MLAVISILALAYPFIVRSYYLSLGIEVLIFSIFAMSLDLLLGYTGLPSFGHAAFFGLGAYILAYTTSAANPVPRTTRGRVINRLSVRPKARSLVLVV